MYSHVQWLLKYYVSKIWATRKYYHNFYGMWQNNCNIAIPLAFFVFNMNIEVRSSHLEISHCDRCAGLFLKSLLPKEAKCSVSMNDCELKLN